tara:strand:- start:181187 stop:181684 length:498 start_codon:yes stop_codon:yes gene_type:complete
MDTTVNKTTNLHGIISMEDLMKHWQGHRNLTRRVIEAFPEDAIFKHTIGGMRPFSEMVMELLGIAGPGIKEIATGVSAPLNEHFEHGNKKSKILELWDASTNEINMYWDKIKPEQFQDRIKLFGQYDGTVYSSICYFIDNEIHHRGQAYVYLRSLGIEPPAFYER